MVPIIAGGAVDEATENAANVSALPPMAGYPAWTSCEDQMPAHGRNVLATYTNCSGRRRIIVAHYFERWKEESCYDEDNYDEYHEEKDAYFQCEGWYEQQDNWGDYAAIFVNEGKVDYWMPLPKAPAG